LQICNILHIYNLNAGINIGDNLMKCLVLGAGLVGSTIALDLAMDRDMDVTVADVNQSSLDKLKQRILT
jgi:3-hydroxyacyl-CoA dehydrogenase